MRFSPSMLSLPARSLVVWASDMVGGGAGSPARAVWRVVEGGQKNSLLGPRGAGSVGSRLPVVVASLLSRPSLSLDSGSSTQVVSCNHVSPSGMDVLA